MAEITKYNPGTFCWTDLGTTDSKAAKKFYQGLFGWQVKDFPMGEGEPYSMFYVDEKEVCALYSSSDEQRKSGTPPNWLPYISVANADETTKKIENAGGKVCKPPFDVMDVGRMAVIQDPTAAVFALWQARRHIGARIYDEPSTVSWRELFTPNIDISGKFYSMVFGWNLHTENFGGIPYNAFKIGEEGVAGMVIPPTKDIPPHWLTYWTIENCEKTVEKTRSLGGAVLKTTTKIPSLGQFAVLADPQGAEFGVMQFE